VEKRSSAKPSLEAKSRYLDVSTLVIITRKQHDKYFPQIPQIYAEKISENQRDLREKISSPLSPTYASVSTSPKGELICNCHFNLCCFLKKKWSLDMTKKTLSLRLIDKDQSVFACGETKFGKAKSRSQIKLLDVSTLVILTENNMTKNFPQIYAEKISENQRDLREKISSPLSPTYASVSTSPKGELICNCHFNLCCFLKKSGHST
jgi:hypothetical protein